MRYVPWLVLALGVTVTERCTAKDPIADSVVKIYATCRGPDFERPWAKGNAQEASGSGVIIDGKRILTSAHVVRYASQIFVQAKQSSERVPAKVKAVAPYMDLAVIEVQEQSFFDGRPPVPLAQGLPGMRQTVSVYGYPIGGEQLSVTQGIVSRIECSPMSVTDLGLWVQIDAAVNAGNSGGPAVVDGRILGLVYGKAEKAENISYLVAAEEVAMFLKDIAADGVYHGKPGLWEVTQPIDNDALRARLGLGKDTGVMIVEAFSSAPDYPLKRWDVITRIGDHSLDNMGQVKLKDDLKLAWGYFVSKLAKDGRVKLTILRDRKKHELSVPVRSDPNLVIPFLMGNYPRYFICGPMVFMQATQEQLFAMTASPVWRITLGMVKSPLLARQVDRRAFDGEEIVTLGHSLLPHRISKGYRGLGYSVVTHVNGTAVRNLAHVVELLRDAKGEFLTIDLAGRSPPLVFRREEALKATDEILADEGIRRQCSEDLEGIWRARK
jgi:S1-C subfamily serine protease